MNVLRIALASVIATGIAVTLAGQTRKPFTITDEIGLTTFNTPGGGDPQIRFSPDGKHFAVWTERGRLDLNRVEDSLSFYRSDEVRNFIADKASVKPPPPVWVLARATSKDGPVITNWRWLADS